MLWKRRILLESCIVLNEPSFVFVMEFVNIVVFRYQCYFSCILTSDLQEELTSGNEKTMRIGLKQNHNILLLVYTHYFEKMTEDLRKQDPERASGNVIRMGRPSNR